MKRPQFRIKIPQVAKRIKNFAASILPMAMNAASLGHEINAAERAAPAGEPPLSVYSAPEIVLPPVAQVPPVPIEAPEAPEAPEGEPKLHPLVAALKKSCSVHGYKCARGRNASLLNFVPTEVARRLEFDEAAAAYVAASKISNKKKRDKAMKAAFADLGVAALNECLPCRDVAWLRRTDPTKEAKLRKDLLAVWRRKHLGTKCVGKHCGGLKFDDLLIRCLELDHAGNAHLKKRRKGGTSTNGPTEVQAFVDVADMFREVLECTPKCAYCHCVDTTAEVGRKAAAEDIRRATVPEGESKAQRRSREEAIRLRQNRVDKKDYINGLKREIGPAAARRRRATSPAGASSSRARSPATTWPTSWATRSSSTATPAATAWRASRATATPSSTTSRSSTRSARTAASSAPTATRSTTRTPPTRAARRSARLASPSPGCASPAPRRPPAPQ